MSLSDSYNQGLWTTSIDMIRYDTKMQFLVVVFWNQGFWTTVKFSTRWKCIPIFQCRKTKTRCDFTFCFCFQLWYLWLVVRNVEVSSTLRLPTGPPLPLTASVYKENSWGKPTTYHTTAVSVEKKFSGNLQFPILTWFWVKIAEHFVGRAHFGVSWVFKTFQTQFETSFFGKWTVRKLRIRHLWTSTS